MSCWAVSLAFVVLIAALSVGIDGRRRRGRRRQMVRGTYGIGNQQTSYSYTYPQRSEFNFENILRQPSTDWVSTVLENLRQSSFHFPRKPTTAWWNGPNVCEEKSEDAKNMTITRRELMKHFLSSSKTCEESETSMKCKIVDRDPHRHRYSTVVLGCCQGYTRNEGDYGCPRKLELINLKQKAEELQLTEFLKATKIMELESKLLTESFTVFAPVDGAYSIDDDIIDSGIISGVMVRDAPSAIIVSETGLKKTVKLLQGAMLGHFIEGAIPSRFMEDEDIIPTIGPEGASIRINYFANQENLMTANCVPVLSRDNIATNGVINTIDDFLMPVTQTILDIVKERPDMTMLKTAIEASNLVSKLDGPGSLTLVAPTNNAFMKMNSRMRERLLNGDSDCLRKILLGHLVPNVICSSAVERKAKMINMLRKHITLTRSEDNKFFVNRAQALKLDVMGTNGVVHIIDEVLAQEEAFSMTEMLKDKGYTEFLKLIEEADLAEEFDNLENVTLFAPTNEAVLRLPASVKSKLKSDKDDLKQLLSYHVAFGTFDCSKLRGQPIVSLEGNTMNFISMQAPAPYLSASKKKVQCAALTGEKMDTCGGQIKGISKVMIPPVGDVVDVLSSNKNFSIFLGILKRGKAAEILQGKGPFTVLAPTNQAMEQKGIAHENDLRKKKVKGFLMSHIFKELICCTGMSSYPWAGLAFYHSLAGRRVSAFKNWRGVIKFDFRTKATKCDITATNGNVIQVDRPLSRSRFSDWS